MDARGIAIETSPKHGPELIARALNDPHRLSALSDAGLLDPSAEDAFDRLTAAAARMLRVPVALVALVDDRRQYFKSKLGTFPEPWETTRECDLEHSFCKHIVADELPLVVGDARADPVLRKNLSVRDLGVVAYLGAPLRGSRGEILGSFCVIDTKPREWTPDDVAAVVALAEIASREVAVRTRARAIERDHGRLVAILESAAEGILGLDLDGTVSFANHAAERILGRPSTELIGAPAHDLLHGIDGDGHVCGDGPCDDEKAVRSGKTVARDTTLCRKGGASFPARYTSAVKRDAGKVTGAVMVFTDRTEQVELERQRQEFADRFRSLFDNTRDAILLTAPDGTVYEANDAALEMFGLTLDELRSLGRGGVVDTTDPRLPELISMRQHNGFASGTLRLKRRDGTTFEADLSSTVFQDSAGNALTSMSIRDVSERKRLENELRETAARLAERVASERQFEEILGHELRTPLLAMASFAQLIRREGMSLERARELADHLERDAARAGRLIDGLLQLERTETGREQILREPVDLGALLRQLVATIGPTAPRHRIALDLEGDLTVRGDRDRLTQAFTNVIGNAIKYSPDGGTVNVSCRATPAGIVTSIRDRGVGIAGEDLDRIFQRHVRLAGRAREIKGSGLGLQLARAIVELHGGRISAESAGEGKGSTFTVVLPPLAGAPE